MGDEDVYRVLCEEVRRLGLDLSPRSAGVEVLGYGVLRKGAWFGEFEVRDGVVWVDQEDKLDFELDLCDPDFMEKFLAYFGA